MSERKHQTGWEDGRQVSLRKCGEVVIPNANRIFLSADEPEPCPVCGAQIVLRWDVRIEELSS